MSLVPNSSQTGFRLLIIGNSRIARKRILPALSASGRVLSIDMASRHSTRTATQKLNLSGKIFNSYEKALAESQADLVYISLVNSAHATWAKQALNSGRHVIIDKPAVTEYSDAVGLVDLAKQNNRALFEATVFQYHPQIKAIAEEFTKRHLIPTRISALFSFPPLEAGDFRYQSEYGGGALHDLGPYAIHAGTVFFEEQPQKIFCHVNSRASSGIETSFTITALYSMGRSMVGHFGFDTEYQNTINVLGAELCVQGERIFTIPADHENQFVIRHNNVTQTRTIPPSDCFLNFFNRVFDACAHRDYDAWYEHFLADARSLDMLKKSAQKEMDP